MNLKCALGIHNWSKDCEQCLVCGKTRSQSHDWSKDCEKCAACERTRGQAHDWSKDCEKCSTCGKARSSIHSWSGCKCAQCGKTRDEGHDWQGCRCTVCEKQRDENHDWDKQRQCTCMICGKKASDEEKRIVLEKLDREVKEKIARDMAPLTTRGRCAVIARAMSRTASKLLDAAPRAKEILEFIWGLRALDVSSRSESFEFRGLSKFCRPNESPDLLDRGGSLINLVALIDIQIELLLLKLNHQSDNVRDEIPESFVELYINVSRVSIKLGCAEEVVSGFMADISKLNSLELSEETPIRSDMFESDPILQYRIEDISV